jgi:two-component system, cell cycle sensor histidine kinase and response regulator CckA
VKKSKTKPLPRIRKIERRQWWLSWAAVLVTLILSLGLASFAFPMLRSGSIQFDPTQMNLAMRGMVGLVLIFDVYTIYQQFQIHLVRRQLVEREELFRLITENAADMIAVVGADGRRIYNSPSYARILGYTSDELDSTVPLSQVHPDDQEKVTQAASEALANGVGKRIEYRMMHKDGTWRTLESTASTISGTTEVPGKLVIVNRDITGRRQLEDQFRQSQKMEAVGRLSGGIAHDFNNLLGLIIGYAEILQEQIGPDEAQRSSVEEILNAGRRAAALTRQLLAFSRQQVLEPKVLDLNAVIVDVKKMLDRMIGEDVQMTTRLDPNLSHIKTDQGQIEQVLMNLAVNARDAMPGGGKLVIETQNTQIDDAFARRYPYPVQTGPYVLLTVSDSGVGMDAATQARVFEPFFTTKEKGKGTGLGLSTVYGVVKQSGGYIDIQSELGVGTTFKIYLPRVEAAVETGGDALPQGVKDSQQGAETILVVEDEEALRKLARNILAAYGYTVLEAEDGPHALEISKRFRGAINLMLTDVIMPGMNGPSLAQQITQQRPEIKVVYMSGYTGQVFNKDAVLNPGSIFVQKPFTREALAKKIREALDGRAARLESLTSV